MSFKTQGYELVNDFMAAKWGDAIRRETQTYDWTHRRGGVRRAEKHFRSVAALINSRFLMSYAQGYLGGKPVFVRSILFNKTPVNNWLVAWHQDKTIVMSEKKEVYGWGPWSVKDGCHHVQPPVEVLNKMVTFRIHIDASTRENGCLEVIANSHCDGLMSVADIKHRVRESSAIICEARPNSALIMRPHLLHSSRKASQPSNRRVLHVEYCRYTLPDGLSWA